MEAYQLEPISVTYFLTNDEPIHAFTKENHPINFLQGDALEVSFGSSPLPGLILVDINGTVRLKRFEPLNSNNLFPPENDVSQKPIYLGQVTSHIRLSKWFSSQF